MHCFLKFQEDNDVLTNELFSFSFLFMFILTDNSSGAKEGLISLCLPVLVYSIVNLDL